MITQDHHITVVKEAGRALGTDKMRSQLQTIVSGVNTANRTQRGWNVELVERNGKFATTDHPEYGYTGPQIYSATLSVNLRTDKHRESIDVEFQNIVAAIEIKCVYPKWRIFDVDGIAFKGKNPATINMRAEVTDAADAVGYAPIVVPSDWDNHFTHLYGLDDHISRVRKALDAAILSNWRHRFHCVLIGPPGCGKSDICHSIKKALGEESVMEFDGTSTTMAGAQKELAEREELPRVLLVEEIEKAPESSMSWLLSLMDLRSEIRKTTARSNIMRDTKMICIATVNDLPTFKRFNFGALESRFSNKIFFQRPSRELLGKIAAREIEAVGGDLRWIEPTLDYAEAIDTTDPREIIAIALCGRESLLSGEYQKQLLSTGMPQSNESSDHTDREVRARVARLLSDIADQDPIANIPSINTYLEARS